MNKIEIHIITYNEEVMLPVTITHYKRMFTDPIIIVHDNESTDNTVQIATDNGCQVIPFKTNGLSDSAYTKIKSQAHLTANADWCLCVDCDEHCYINTEDLEDLEKRNVNIVQFQGWDIFAHAPHPESIAELKGIKSAGESKPILVRVGQFSEYLVEPGAHTINRIIPKQGVDITWSKFEYKLLHMKHWNLEFVVNRQAGFGRRLSEENRKNGWGFHYNFPAQKHIDYFTNGINASEKITDKRIKQ